MSAKLGAMTLRKPYCSSAHGACSRDEPQPKFSRASEHRRALVARLVQHEIRIERTLAVVHVRLAAIEIAPLVEEVRAEAGALDRLQELLGDDRVGVDVGPIERRDETFFG